MDSPSKMNIAVIGAGAIGSLVAGYLKRNGETASLIGRPHAVEAIEKQGLHISGVRGDVTVTINASERLREKPDLAILAVKTQDLEQALRANEAFLKDSCVLTTQNGIQADYIVAKYLPREHIVSSIVMFGATHLEPAEVVHNFEGNWVIGKFFCSNDSAVNELRDVLNTIFPTLISDNIGGMKYLKIFLNANNCIPAILGTSMQEAFRDLTISRISIAIWKEGLDIVKQSGVALASLPDFPLERLTGLAAMPMDEAAKIFSGIMSSLSKEPLYGSILQSIKRGRPSEIDYINGEFVNLARKHNLKAPLNEELVEMVHQVEKNNTFFRKERLLAEAEKFIT
ncbi:MAG: 2-dehydropantoate 2-reductase [Pseudomonadota bacterium]